jgi:hypothetical protein
MSDTRQYGGRVSRRDWVPQIGFSRLPFYTGAVKNERLGFARGKIYGQENLIYVGGTWDASITSLDGYIILASGNSLSVSL